MSKIHRKEYILFTGYFTYYTFSASHQETEIKNGAPSMKKYSLNNRILGHIREDIDKKGLSSASAIHGISIDLCQKVSGLTIEELDNLATKLTEMDLIVNPISLSISLNEPPNKRDISKNDVLAETAFHSA